MKHPALTLFETKLAKAVADLPRKSRYLIGVSGGRDSVALLHALVQLGFRNLVVCHLNHGLRGRSATADANFVEKLSLSLKLMFEAGKIDTAALAKDRAESIETAARHARYEFFAKVARKRRCRTLFVAHHADDQVETFLFNLFRGAGQSGLAGMSREAERAVSGISLRILRPMLGIWRTEIDEYIALQRLRFREDASNAGHDYTRNRIRHKLLPEIEELFGGRKVAPSIWRIAEIARAEDEWLDALTGDESTPELSVPELRIQPVAQQRRRILKWLRTQGVPELGFEAVETVRSMLAETGPAKVNLPGNWHARRRDKKLFLEKGNSA